MIAMVHSIRFLTQRNSSIFCGDIMINRFSVDFVCPPGFEKLAAEICFDGQIICRLLDEHPDGVMELDFFFLFREPVTPIRVPLDELLSTIQNVRSELLEIRRSNNADIHTLP